MNYLFKFFVGNSEILVGVSFWGAFLWGFYYALRIEKIKKRITNKLLEQGGEEILRKIILEDRREESSSEREIQQLKKYLSSLNRSELKSELINTVLTKISWKNILFLGGGLIFWKFRPKPRPKSFVKALFLEKTARDNPSLLREIRGIDNSYQKQRKLSIAILSVLIFVLIASVISFGYRVLYSPNYPLLSPQQKELLKELNK